MSLFRLPIIRHGQTSWDKSLLSEAEFMRRVERVREVLREQQLGAMLVYSDMIHSGRAAYLINCHVFDPRMPNLVMVTPDSFDAVLKVTGRELFFFSKLSPARLYNVDFLSGDMSIKIGELAKEYGVIGKRIGLVGRDYMPADLLVRLKNIFGVEAIEDCDALYTSLQRDKSAVEQSVMKIAAQRAEAVLADIVAYAKPGVSEHALAARADYAARINGCQDVEFLVYSPELAKRAWPKDHPPFRPVGTRVLAEGDSVGIYLAVQVHGYWVELSQTVFIGQPSERQLEAQRRALDRYEQLLRTLRPSGNYGPDQWNDETTSVWLHGTGNDREEGPYPTMPGESLVSGDLMSAHIAVKSDDGIIFVGRQIAVSEDGSRRLVEAVNPEH